MKLKELQEKNKECEEKGANNVLEAKGKVSFEENDILKSANLLYTNT